MVKKQLSPNPRQMMTCLNPLDALIPKIPFSFFAEFRVRATSGARRSVSVGSWRPRQLGLPRGLYGPPPPPKLKTRPPQGQRRAAVKAGKPPESERPFMRIAFSNGKGLPGPVGDYGWGAWDPKKEAALLRDITGLCRRRLLTM